MDVPYGYSKLCWVWQFFTKENVEKMECRCNLCGNLYKYSVLSNLRKHLDKMHPTVDTERGQEKVAAINEDGEWSERSSEAREQSDTEYVPGKEEYDDAGSVVEPEITVRQRELPRISLVHLSRRKSKNNWLWNYFKVANQEKRVARCKFCKNLYYYRTIGNLKKHLKSRHADRVNVEKERSLEEVVIEQDDDQEEIGDKLNRVSASSEREMASVNGADEVSLYDESAQHAEVYTVERKVANGARPRRRRFRTSAARRPARSPATPEPVAGPGRRGLDDPLSHFAAYACSLLRLLPLERANTLQAQFVASLLTEQIKYNSRQTQTSQTDPVDGGRCVEVAYSPRNKCEET